MAHFGMPLHKVDCFHKYNAENANPKMTGIFQYIPLQISGSKNHNILDNKKSIVQIAGPKKYPAKTYQAKGDKNAGDFKMKKWRQFAS